MNGSNGLTAKPYEPSSSKQKKRFHDTWPRSTLLPCGEKVHKKWEPARTTKPIPSHDYITNIGTIFQIIVLWEKNFLQ